MMQNKSSIVLNMNLNASGFARGIKSVIGSVKNMNESMKDATNTASKMSSVMKGIGSSAIKVGKGLAVAGAAAATAVTALVSKSVGAFADYEQLTGGVETLFGAGGRSVEEYAQSVGKSVSDVQGKYDSLMSAQNVVLENANKAYMTAGMSANEYMDTVTGFSASLISSLGGDTNKAADYANSALVDMSDNANKMGTDMESIKNAYQGFAKQNYTMLDNLKLGYGGTQEEMKRLLSDAEKLTGQRYDISSFADITQAIHAIQTQMDITGTTAKEASTTISGSWGSLKAAFQNVLVGLTTGGDMFDQSLDALINTAVTFGQNIIPAIKGALSGIGYLIEGLAPVIGETIPPLINDLAPTLANSAVSLISSLVNGLTQSATQFSECLSNMIIVAVAGISTVVPQLLDAASKIVSNLMQGLTNSMPQIVNGAVTLIEGLVNGLVNNIPLLIMGAVQLVASLANGLIANLPRIIDAGVNLITGIVSASYSMMPQIIQNGMQLVVNLAVGLVRAIPQLIAALPRITGAIVKGFKSVNWFDLGLQLIKSIWEGIKSIGSEMWNGVKEKTSELWGGVKNVVSEKLNNIKSAYDAHGGGLKGATFAAIEGVKEYYRTGYDAINQLTGGKLGEVVNAVGEKMEVVKGKFSEAFGNVKNTVMTIFENIKNGITEKISAAVNKVKEIFGSIADKVSEVWGKIKGIIKAPKIVQKGTVSIAGVSTPIPKLGLEWNAKGGIMTRPTAFGYANGKVQMGGEAGAEAILPLRTFWNNLSQYIAESNKGGNTITNEIKIVINADNKTADEIADDVINVIVPKIQKCMANM
jgi:phage-related protein